MSIIRLFLFTALIIAYSCSSLDKQKDQDYKSDSIKVSFKLNPKLGKVYQYQVNNSTTINQKINNENIENNNKLELGIAYTFSKDSSENLRVAIRYNKFKVLVKMMDVEKELDAANALSSSDPSEKMFAALNNAVLNATLDTLGNVKSITGDKVISDRMYQIANGDEEAVKMLNGSIRQFVGEAFFKQTTEQNFKFFTDRQLKVGDTITQINSINTGFIFTIKSIYELSSVEDDIASINVKANIEMNDQPITVDGTNLTASLKGKQTGKIRIDLNTGILQNSSSDLKVEGVLQLKFNEVPINFRMINSTKLLQ